MKRLHLKQFKTRNIGDDVTKGFIGQTFKFVVPKDLSSEDKFPIEVSTNISRKLFHDIAASWHIILRLLQDMSYKLMMGLTFLKFTCLVCQFL